MPAYFLSSTLSDISSTYLMNCLTPTNTTLVVSLGSLASTTLSFVTSAYYPNNNSATASTATVVLVHTVTNMNITVSVQIHRINSTGTIQSSGTATAAQTTAATNTFNTVSEPSWSTTCSNRILVRLTYTNTAMSTQSCTLGTNRVGSYALTSIAHNSSTCTITRKPSNVNILVRNKRLLTFGDLGLTAYWDASTVVSSPVSTWSDGVGSNNATATGASRPLLVTSDLNGYNTIQFDGVDDGMDLTSTINVASGFTTYAVALRSAATGDWFSLTEKDSPFAPHGPFWVATSVYMNNNAATYSALSSVTGWTIISCTTSQTIRLNGSDVSTSLFTTAAGSGLFDAIGKRFAGDGTENTVGKFAFVGVKNSSSTTFDMQRFEGLVAHRYNLTSLLPSTHPYKDRPPYFI